MTGRRAGGSVPDRDRDLVLTAGVSGPAQRLSSKYQTLRNFRLYVRRDIPGPMTDCQLLKIVFHPRNGTGQSAM